MSAHSVLTALADEVRELSGETQALGFSKMTEYIADANDEVDSQAATIAEISALLDGKGVLGGGTEIETCTVIITGDLTIGFVGATIYQNGNVTDYRENYSVRIIGEATSELTINNVVCNSVFSLQFESGTMPAVTVENGDEEHYVNLFYIKPTVPGGTTTVTSYDAD